MAASMIQVLGETSDCQTQIVRPETVRWYGLSGVWEPPKAGTQFIYMTAVVAGFAALAYFRSERSERKRGTDELRLMQMDRQSPYLKARKKAQDKRKANRKK